MADIADLANERIEADYSSNLAKSTSQRRPKGMVPCGRCWECDTQFEDEEPGHYRKLFCAAEPGQRQSDCVADYERREAQKRMMGRG